jgi:hypothetical protein
VEGRVEGGGEGRRGGGLREEGEGRGGREELKREEFIFFKV